MRLLWVELLHMYPFYPNTHKQCKLPELTDELAKQGSPGVFSQGRFRFLGALCTGSSIAEAPEAVAASPQRQP